MVVHVHSLIHMRTQLSPSLPLSLSLSLSLSDLGLFLTHFQGTSDLSALCQIMCAMFVDHCPVYSKSAATRQQQQPSWGGQPQPVRPPATYATPSPYGARPPYPQYPPQQQQQYPGEHSNTIDWILIVSIY